MTTHDITKSQELAIIRDTITRLGPDSYLGPWLMQIQGELEACMRSDFFPEVSLKTAQEVAAMIRQSAKDEAKQLTDNALKGSKELFIKANKDVSELRLNLLHQLRKAEKALTEFSY